MNNSISPDRLRAILSFGLQHIGIDRVLGKIDSISKEEINAATALVSGLIVESGDHAGVYRHFKQGTLYRAIDTYVTTGTILTGKTVVAYVETANPSRRFVREVENFDELVASASGVPKDQPRFKYVGPALSAAVGVCEHLVTTWKTAGWTVDFEYNSNRDFNQLWTCEISEAVGKLPLPYGLGYVCGYGATREEAALTADARLHQIPEHVYYEGMPVEVFVEINDGGAGDVYCNVPATVHFDDTECPEDFSTRVHTVAADVKTLDEIHTMVSEAADEHKSDTVKTEELATELTNRIVALGPEGQDAFETDHLDNLVHDLAAPDKAADINNQGPAHQVRFILGEMGLEDGRRSIIGALNDYFNKVDTKPGRFRVRIEYADGSAMNTPVSSEHRLQAVADASNQRTTDSEVVLVDVVREDLPAS